MLRAALCLVLLAACRPPPTGESACHGGLHACGNAGVDPDACGPLDGNDAQREVHALFAGAAAIDRASVELDDAVHRTCLEMGAVLDVPGDGDTAGSCAKVAAGLDAALAASTQGALVTKVTPGACEAAASADVAAALAVRCAEPAIEVEAASVTVTDSPRFQQARNAIETGLPRLALAASRIEAAAPAVAAFAQQADEMQQRAPTMVGDFGEQSLCVARMLAMIHDAAPQLQAKVTASFEASAKLSASAGARTQ